MENVSEEIIETVQNGNKPHETVKEYIERKRNEEDSNKLEKIEQKSKKKNTQDEEAKEVLSTVGKVITAVPHVATFALGGLSGAGLASIIKEGLANRNGKTE